MIDVKFSSVKFKIFIIYFKSFNILIFKLKKL
nr:MAG TPA: hypothetical protein [Caudoviricetes sp.]